ncbi:MAG: S-layer homology domain-containing protein [Oscillospiraceae bacterium]|nr:S-layer homology domain-containing protein [Oscillospiraceae bacterium]
MEAASSAKWMVVRKSTDTFGIQDKTFQGKVTGDARISNNYINNLLASVDSAGKSDDFKALYSFDDSEFAKAREEGKKLMMMLGTTWNLENTYPPLEYMQFVTAFYGNEFAYFYKGHPGNYESNSPENTALYKTINVGMLEPSIAAELFSFFNPDICVSGYESSYFQNTGDASQDFALFRRTKDVAYADGNVGVYADRMDLFISDMGDQFDPNTFTTRDSDSDAMKAAKERSRAARDMVQALVPEGETNDKNYMVEFNNTDEKTVCQYDYAIWNYSKSLIHYIGKDADGNNAIVSTVSAKGCDGGEDCPSKQFTDVDTSLWYHDYVDYAVRNGLFMGTSETTFEPDTAMTRAMLVTVLHRMEGTPEAQEESKFTDLEDDWYKAAVAWAAENGIVMGTDEEHFEPNGQVTREQAMTMLMRYAKYKGMDVSATIDLAKFADADAVSDWALESVQWAVASGLIQGMPDNTIQPQGESTRAQIATILMRFQTNRV